MSVRIVGLGLLLLAVAPGSAQLPPAGPKPDWLEADPFTAFPKLAAPPPAAADAPRPALPKLVFPPNATPLEKVRIAQVNQGETFLIRARTRIELGQFDTSDYEEYSRVAAETYKVKGELAADPGGKVAAYEARVVVFKEVEAFTVKRVEAGTDRPQSLNLVRFWRLQAEKELLLLQEELAKAGKK